jgi:hypothetical protein
MVLKNFQANGTENGVSIKSAKMAEWKNDFNKLLAIQNQRHQKHNEELEKQMALLEVPVLGG